MLQRDARPPFAAIGGAVPPEFAALPTPCYLLDEAALTCNAEILGNLSRRTGCRVLLAQKAFSNYDLYPLLAPHLAGTEASGLFEARLGAEEMPSKEVHVFCAAYRADEMEELLQYADHIVFNSPAQLAKFGPAAKAAGKSVGLRINPECSTQDGHAIYDPCAPGSRLGTTRAQWDAAVAAHPELPERLRALSLYARRGMTDRGLKIRESALTAPTPIIPIYTYETYHTLEVARDIYDRGVYVNPTLPPATPEGEALLRTSYMATHTEALLDEAMDIMADVLVKDHE